MKISNTGYVTIEIQQSLLEMVRVKCVPTGETRTKPNGEIEAKFFCIEPGTNQGEIWATKSQLIIPNQQTKLTK